VTDVALDLVCLLSVSHDFFFAGWLQVLGAVVVARGVSSVLTMRKWRRELIVVEGKRKGLPYVEAG